MTQEFDNTNKGALFVSDRKLSDKHPDLTGTINVEGVEYHISAWKRKDKGGTKSFLSLSVTKKAEATKSAAPKPKTVTAMPDKPF